PKAQYSIIPRSAKSRGADVRQQVLLRRPPMSAAPAAWGSNRTSGSDGRTIAVYESSLLLSPKPATEVEATSILPSLNGKTARSWRGIVPFTHLAREGRMTVTIGRRELLVALGGAAVAWPLAARAQQPGKLPTIGFLGPSTSSAGSPYVAAFVQRL